MKLLYLTTVDPRSQGDFQEVIMLHGLRTLLGENCIDYPRKKVIYRDFSETNQTDLHGYGFTLYTQPIKDINNRELKDIDYILYGVTNAYGITDYEDINKLTKNIWYLDGHDHSNIQKKPCFKRELFNEEEGVYPTGFGIPHYQIRPLNFKRNKLYQNTAPPYSLFNNQLLGLEARNAYIYKNENDYYNDMYNSWFGLTCIKGGWDSLRHYEIIANGSCLLFRDYDKKPKLCSPQELPCYSYSTNEELYYLMNKLIINNEPTQEYYDMILKQRNWLLKYGTTEARALNIIQTIVKNKI
jgi:hypothetical protein